MMAPVTASFAVLIILLIVLLAMNTTRLRFTRARSTDPADKEAIRRASRAHGNTFEHGIPLLLLMFFYEIQGGEIRILCIIGTLFLLARAIYVYGMLTRPASQPMQLGASLTYLLELVLVGLLALKVFVNG
jgi:uncharacterized membrane protein YecN with MAPEG domain